jgi:hypothetical protein
MIPGSAPQAINLTALLTPGRHSFDIQIHWPGPVDFLEVRWQPPGKPLQIMESPELRPTKPGVLLRSTLPGTPPTKGSA